MPVLEKCFQPFSDEEAFANLSKNIFEERRENKPQQRSGQGQMKAESDVPLRTAARHRKVSEPLRAGVGFGGAPRLPDPG